MVPLRRPVAIETSERSPLRSERSLMGIYEISKILCGPGNLPQLLISTLSVLHSFLDMGNGVIALFDENGDPATVVSASLDNAGAREYFAGLPERVVGQMVVTAMPVLVKDVAADTSFGIWDTRLWGPSGGNFAFFGVPIRDRDKVIGTMTIDRCWAQPGDLRLDDDVRFLKMAANLIGQTVRLHRLLMRDRERLLADQRRLEKEREELARPERTGATRIVGDSAAIKAALEQARRVARSDASVLLRGESGTGKELFAEAIHEASPRKGGPFIKLNCAALPESVLESELFGHEKGAFTGAVAQRKGRFELADNGTLFLDEIGEISGAFQAKLLRVLQDGEFERVGGTRTIHVKVRLITATNRNLEDAVAKGTFRADLYYRIAVVPLFLPALRDRPGDIPQLAQAFLDRFNKDNKTHLRFSKSAVDVLEACYFPGNVRELENCVRRTATLAHGDCVADGDLSCRNDGCLSSVLWKTIPTVSLPIVPALRVSGADTPPPKTVAPVALVPAAADAPGLDKPTCASAATCRAARGDGPSEYEALVAAMEKSGWVQAKAARLLNLTPRQIGYALRKHNIPIKKF